MLSGGMVGEVHGQTWARLHQALALPEPARLCANGRKQYPISGLMYFSFMGFTSDVFNIQSITVDTRPGVCVMVWVKALLVAVSLLVGGTILTGCEGNATTPPQLIEYDASGFALESSDVGPGKWERETTKTTKHGVVTSYYEDWERVDSPYRFLSYFIRIFPDIDSACEDYYHDEESKWVATEETIGDESAIYTSDSTRADLIFRRFNVVVTLRVVGYESIIPAESVQNLARTVERKVNEGGLRTLSDKLQVSEEELEIHQSWIGEWEKKDVADTQVNEMKTNLFEASAKLAAAREEAVDGRLDLASIHMNEASQLLNTIPDPSPVRRSLIGGLIAAVIAAGLLVFFLLKQKRSAASTEGC